MYQNYLWALFGILNGRWVLDGMMGRARVRQIIGFGMDGIMTS
jgi:hypothetical protein